MKVRSIELRNFKRFSERLVNFADEEAGLAKNLVVLVGENGAGKSSVLQAIAATLGTATKRLSTPSDLKWPGFVLDQVGNAWSSAPEVKATIEFSRDEIDATTEYFNFLAAQKTDSTQWTPPGNEQTVELTLRDGHVTSNDRASYFQCRGREYARQIVKSHPTGHRIFERVGQVFWYTEHRTTTSLTPSDIGREVPAFDLQTLRRRLADWYYFHRDIETGVRQLRGGERDIYTAIQQAYALVFPGRQMQGPRPRTEIDDIMKEPWFYFTDGKHSYELAELSGGERAVFPLIVDFANWNLHRSVILIDEIELHLHPPVQQALVRALQDLGKDNQFIITTHSDAVVDILPDASILRIED